MRSGGRSGGRSGMLTKKSDVASRRVGRRLSDIHEKEGKSGGGGGGSTFCAVLPQRRIAAYLIFTTCTNHDISLHPVWESPYSRLEGGAVATFTIPSSFSNAAGEQAKKRRQNIRYLAHYMYHHIQFIDQAAHGSCHFCHNSPATDNRISRGERESCRTKN